MSTKDPQVAYRYIRDKVDQLLTLMGTQPLREEELDDATLVELDPIGIIAEAFSQVLRNQERTHHQLTVARNAIRTILDSLPAAVVVLNDDLTIDDCNRQARERFFRGLGPDEVVGRPMDRVCICCGVLEKDLLRRRSGVEEMVIAGRHYQVVISDVRNADGEREKSVFLYFDITRQKLTEQGLQLYAKTFNHTAEGILITDHENRILEVNEAFCRITGYAEEELVGNTPAALKSGLHDSFFYREIWRRLGSHGHWQGEILDRTRDGSVIPLLQTISEVRDANGALTNRISVITDISSLKETQSRLDFLAHHDALTELPNRVLFCDRLGHAIERARRDGDQLALLFIDLDRFKNINDSLGHLVGDRILVEVAGRLSNLLRRSDTIARLGGDEFVILAERPDGHDDAFTLADKVVQALREPFTLDERELHLGCSIGIALYPEDGDDAVTLLKNADAAMYRVKESGRDGYFKYNARLSAAADDKLLLENNLRQAVREDRLILHYQPIVDLTRGRVVAAEALLRWPLADGGYVPPDRFIPVAEESRLIIPIGRRVIEGALAQWASWARHGVCLDYLSVNVSVSQIYAPGFADHLFQELARHEVAGDRLQVELTENVLMYDVRSCSAVLSRLREHGVRIAIDDFGTGYSSLAYLKQLPIDTLKLDRTFVHDTPGDGNANAIARAVIGLADTLGLGAVAEGVETEAQERYLRSIGCRTVQGFRYARPMPGDAFATYLGGRRVAI